MRHCSVKFFAVIMAAVFIVFVSSSETQAQWHHDAHHHHGRNHHGRHHHRNHFDQRTSSFSLSIGTVPYGYYGSRYSTFYGYRSPGFYASPFYGSVYRSYGDFYRRPGCRSGGIYIGW